MFGTRGAGSGLCVVISVYCLTLVHQGFSRFLKAAYMGFSEDNSHLPPRKCTSVVQWVMHETGQQTCSNTRKELCYPIQMDWLNLMNHLSCSQYLWHQAEHVLFVRCCPIYSKENLVFLILYDDYKNNKTFYDWPGSWRQIWAILSYFLWHILAVVLAPINKILIDQSKTNSEVQHLFPQTGSHLTDGTKFEFLFSSKPLFPYCDSCHWKI